MEMTRDVECNICGGAEFVEMNTRPNARCNKCGSFERTRLLWMYIQSLKIAKNCRILHIAPERCLYDKLKRITKSDNYITADVDEGKYRNFAPECVHIDLCDLDEWPSNEFDLIVHSHVLEHTPCSIAYTLFHLHRMLRSTGWHIFIVPFMSGEYDECFQDIGSEQKTLRFGQHDHVRRFGRNDRNMHIGKLVQLPDDFDASVDFPADALRKANIPENQWRGFGAATVLSLKKYDMKLLSKDQSLRSRHRLSLFRSWRPLSRIRGPQ